MLLGDFIDTPVLDLFAGSGALGVEALSRGASSAVFVERRSPACQVPRELLVPGLRRGAEVLPGEPGERAIAARVRMLALVDPV